MGRWAPSVVSALLCVVLTICYAARPDACAAITIFPVWAWFAPGLFLAAFNLRGQGNRKGWPVLAAWLIFLVFLAEEPWSLGRSLVRTGRPRREVRAPGEVVRVISLNCAVGNRLAAEEVARYRPDIVLLQESPGRSEVEELARRLFGTEAGVIHGVDASLVVHGRAVTAALPIAMRGYFVQARVTLTTGRDLEVISTRLLPALLRVDLWSPDCWREQMQNRRRRREQLRAIARRIGPITAPVIVGGDFNAPQGDAVFRLLQPKLHDAFSEGGVGWGNTIINDYPVLRIDQVWVSSAFDSELAVARSTRNSDHRMVICDLRFKGNRLSQGEE
jgi:endonuclease/exonuclease/phosphatase (EEP) superfamily protein YafD